MSNIVIPQNTALPAIRSIPFTLVTGSNLYTPMDIDTTGVTASLYFGVGAVVGSTNIITKVSGSVGEYYLTLTQAEASSSIGPVRGWVQPPLCALTKFEAYIVPADAFSAAATTTDIATAVMSSSVEPSMNVVGALRVIGAAVAGTTTGAGTTSEVFKSIRNDGGTAKTRVTITNDGTNRTAKVIDTSDDS